MTFPALLDLANMTTEECYEFGKAIYASDYLSGKERGSLKTHDGLDVVFYADRYEHAFRTSPDRARLAYDKSKFAIDRIERIHWIKELLLKSDEQFACKEKTPPPRWKRAYYCYNHCYVVWLEPLKVVEGRPSGWKFSSAYPLPVSEFKRT
uniref:hypothetical protein n=1 Tax=Shinella sp. TaxID=1870904 RepID=UPI003F714944